MIKKDFDSLFNKLKSLPSEREDLCSNIEQVMKTVTHNGLTYLLMKTPTIEYNNFICIGYRVSDNDPRVSSILKKKSNNEYFENLVHFKNGDCFLFHNPLGPAVILHQCFQFNPGMEVGFFIDGIKQSAKDIQIVIDRQTKVNSLKKKLSSLS